VAHGRLTAEQLAPRKLGPRRLGPRGLAERLADGWLVRGLLRHRSADRGLAPQRLVEDRLRGRRYRPRRPQRVTRRTRTLTRSLLTLAEWLLRRRGLVRLLELLRLLGLLPERRRRHAGAVRQTLAGRLDQARRLRRLRQAGGR
jgi:hypothetical protein